MTTADPHNIAWMRRALYSAVIADVLDGLGLREQALVIELRLASGNAPLVGRAKTTLWEDLGTVDPHPYALELKAVDECGTDEVLIAAAGGSMRSAIWGELLSTAARNRGCAGAIVDGSVRDVARMREMGFTVFARGTSPRDSLHRQRVAAVDVPVDMGGVPVCPGDLVFADLDGVVVVPRAVEREVLAKAWEKVTAENRTRDEIRAGMKATDVFHKYGVL